MNKHSKTPTICLLCLNLGLALCLDTDGTFITNPTDIAKYLIHFLIGKLRHDMPTTNADTTHPSISGQIMKDKHCHFLFCKVSVEEVKK